MTTTLGAIDAVISALGVGRAQEIADLIRRAFPDPRCEPDARSIAGFVCGLPIEVRTVLGVADVAVDAILDAVVGVTHQSELVSGYYLAHATHERVGLGAHRFRDTLPMVRVRLPERDQLDLDTKIGVVFAADHKLPTVELFREKYADVLPFEVDHVMLTTAARWPSAFGSRFAAIATYEAFDAQGERRAYVLEGGMATGEAMALYCSPNGHPIRRRAWYKPTPFASDRHQYVGDASFFDADGGPSGPDRLRVGVFTSPQAEAPTMWVTVEYEPYANPRTMLPAELTARAGLRVAAIAVARGEADLVMRAIAPFAADLFERAPK